ncbi:MAG: hypothetical protein RBS07_06685 [Lentimicrobium sp.]|jgi:hypothetical protein|nr:hypothetical protein [Lentimicrobium sp.]
MESSIIHLEELLLKEQSRTNTDFLVQVLKEKPSLFADFWSILMKNNDPVSRRAAWVIDCFTEEQPQYLYDKIEQLIESLPYFSSDGLKRHSMRMLSRSPLPETQLGVITNISFKWLQSPLETVAVKMYCIVILERVTRIYPELIPELCDIIIFQMDEATPGFKSIARKTLRKLRQ